MSTTIKAISDKIATFEKALKSDNTEDFKKKLQDKLAKLKSDLKKASVGEEISAKDLADSLLKSRKKFIEMSSKDFDGVIKRLQTKPEYSFLKSYTRSKIIDDIKRKAKPVGWRFKGRNNFKIPSKEQVKNRRINGVYYENRPDRSDVSQTRQLEHGGEMMEGKEILSFSFNTDNVTQKEIVEIVENYTKDWRTSGDISNVSMFVTLPKSKANELALDLKMEDVYDIERNESRYAKGGSTYQGGGEITIEITKSIDSFDKYYDEVGFEENELSLPFQKGSSTYYVTTKEKSIAEQLESDGFGKIVSTYQGGGEIISNELYEELDKRNDWKIIEKKQHPLRKTVFLTLSKSGDYYRIVPISNGKDLERGATYFTKIELAKKDFDKTFQKYFAKGGSTYAEGGVITNFMKVNDVRTQLKKQGYSEAKINKAFQGVNVGMDKDYKETVIDREGLKNNLPTQDWKDLATNVVSIIKSDSTYAEGGEIFEYKVKQYSNNHTIKELSEIEDKLLKTKNKSKAQQENLMAITTAIGVKRNPDFYKDKMFKGGSTYAEGGSIEDNQPVIRYYFEDEEYEYAQGGMVEHGLQIGDKILSKGIRTIKVENSGKKYVVNLQNGTREDSSEFYFNKKK
jgi:hypothetical protein